MSKQTEPTTFNLHLDQLLRGETVPYETSDLVFARRLLTVDLSPRSRIETALRARLLASKNSHKFPQIPMNSPKHPSSLPRLLPSLAFGAAMILLVLFLAWALTNTTPQPAVNATETPMFAPELEVVPDETATLQMPTVPVPTLSGELFFAIRPTNPPFYYQWVYLPAGCLVTSCTGTQPISAPLLDFPLPDTPLSWSPDGSRGLLSPGNGNLYELDPQTGDWRAIPIDFGVVQENYLWTADSQWVAIAAQGDEDYTVYVALVNLTTGEIRHLNEVPYEERIPLAWLNETELLVKVDQYDASLGSKQNAHATHLVRLDVQTGQETELVLNIGTAPHGWDSLALAPDKSQFAFNTTDFNTHLFVIRADGEQHDLGEVGYAPVWSPDGQWLAVTRTNAENQSEVFVLRPDGSDSHEVFRASGFLNFINWLPDSEHLLIGIYHESNDTVSLHLVTISDSSAQEIVLPGMDVSAFTISQISLRAVTTSPFGEKAAELLPSPTPYPTHEATTGDPLTVLQTLTAKYANDILSGSGWLHLRTRQFVNDEPGTLPNGDPMPNPAIWDDWYQFDDQWQVLHEVNLYMDENGHVNQVSIQRDGQTLNLTLGIRGTSSPFNPNFDLHFTEHAANLIAEGETLTMSDFYIDGQYAGLMFTIQQNATEWEAVFNPDTGALLSYTVYQLAAGGKTIQNVMTMLVQEWVAEPPADILAYLDQEFKPYAPLPPLGTPAPVGFDASSSDLTFKSVNGDDFNAPTFFYMDVYAEDYLLGRFDSGGVPSGYCDRSFDGAYIAFNYVGPEPDYLTTLRWFNVNETANVLEPFPALQQNSPPSFAPQDLRMAFGACEAGNLANCGYYIYNLQTGELTKITNNPAYIRPAWTPDGNYLAYLIPGGSENTDLQQGEVIRADTGEVVFTGNTTEILQKYGVAVLTSDSGMACASAPNTSQSTVPALNPDGTYIVQDGDTLSQIAYDFGLTVETLITLNGLSPEAPAIFPGMVLIVVSPVNVEPPNLAQSDLIFEWIFTGTTNQPIAWADIYAENQYLGQVEFGANDPGAEPGGWCVRSFDGAWIAFAYRSWGVPEFLHWFNVDNVSQVYELPDFAAVMSMAFSPTDNALAFTGCSNDGCGLWLIYPLTGEIHKLNAQGNISSAPPLWSPDGKYLAFLPTEANPVDAGATRPNIIVLQVDNGAVIYEGYAYAAESPLIAWGLPLPDFSEVEGTNGCESAP